MEKILEELQTVRPEMLNDDARKLFCAIMTIADQRDLYKKIIEKALFYIDSIDTGNFINTSELREIKNILEEVEKCQLGK